MTEQEFLEQAADYVGRELDTLASANFLRDVAADPTLRTRLDDMLMAERALRSSLLDPAEARLRTASLSPPFAGDSTTRHALGRIHPFGRRWAGALGLAAAVALAFVGGYFARGGPASVSTQPTITTLSPPPALGVAEWERFARAQREFPRASRFGQALLTLATRTARP